LVGPGVKDAIGLGDGKGNLRKAGGLRKGRDGNPIIGFQPEDLSSNQLRNELWNAWKARQPVTMLETGLMHRAWVASSMDGLVILD